MKTKIKRHSRSVLSVVLALCMLLSCMTAGMIMTDAAKVDSETVGFNTTDWLCVKCGSDNWKEHWVSPGDTVTLDLTAYAAGADVPFNLICSNNNINYVTIQNDKKLYTCTKEILKYRIAGMQMKEIQIGHTLCSPEALKTPLKNRVRQNAQSSVGCGIAKFR